MVFAVLWAGSLQGAVDSVAIRSHSGQFVVHGLPIGPVSGVQSTSTVQYLRLDPRLTAVSLERIRQAIQSRLDWPNEWHGLITVATEPVRGENTRVTISSQRFAGQWSYRVFFPEILDKDRFMNAGVKTILMEFANRRAGEREAELPLWLTEGLTAELMTTSLPVLALEPAAEFQSRGVNADPLARVRDILRQRTPLTFDELSLPTEDSLSEANAELYRACAHLFVHELLRLRNGPAQLRVMLERLPENLNWQTTFLESFGEHFSRLLEVDQWYALNIANVRGRDLSSAFPLATSRQQLRGVLTTSAEVRISARELPLHTELTLQQVIAEWDYPRQHALLVGKIRSLQSLKSRAAPELVEIMEGYLNALLEYVGPRNLALPGTERRRSRLRPKGEAARAIQRLNELDALSRDAAISAR